MTSIYPREANPDLNAPPTYEQATYYPQAPPVPTFFGFQSTSAGINQPQPQPIVGMYSPAQTYSDGKTVPMTVYPPPNMTMPNQGPPMGTQMLITTQSVIYGDMPIQCVCPNCHQSIVTRVEKTTGIVPWLVCGGILLFGGWLGCCLIPFCIDSLKETEHYCPSCANLLGTRRVM